MKPLQQSALQALSDASPLDVVAIPELAIRQKCVLITGAGGSIGSALAHAIAPLKPAQILLLESSEQALYRIDRDLTAPHKTVLATICDQSALEEAFENHCPQIVFHAAAFKHVPLMEIHPFAALQNNAVGTFNLMQTAARYRAEQLVLVSTDKAVDPVSIMGASKRIAELVTLALQSPATKVKAVRLGNVYASQGSVVPLFEEQIAQGSPVTITHPCATRYFLHVEQAAALLLSALSDKFPSAILVPQLTNPIRIVDIAEFLIHQAGSPSQIVYTGLRPGEKLHEQLFSATESLVSGPPAPLRAIQSEAISARAAAEAIEALQRAIQQRNLNQLLAAVTTLVPGYQPSEALLAQQAARPVDDQRLTECRA